jgi:uncharacterized BrkB/YihY/UPF0761 family membrane protein
MTNLGYVYLAMPVGRPSLWHAFFGAVAAVMLWEVPRHALVWYFSTLSQIGTIYGPAAPLWVRARTRRRARQRC